MKKEMNNKTLNKILVICSWTGTHSTKSSTKVGDRCSFACDSENYEETRRIMRHEVIKVLNAENESKNSLY